METYNAILDFLLAAVAVAVIGAAVYMVLTYGISGAWAKRIDLRNLVSGPLIFGMMLLGLRYAPSATMKSTTFGINLAADDTPELKQALGRLLDEVREPAERALNVDSPDSDPDSGGGVTFTTDDGIAITSTPWPTPQFDSAATATAFFEQFPTAVPSEAAPALTVDESAATIVAITRAANPEPPVIATWRPDQPPTPIPGGNR